MEAEEEAGGLAAAAAATTFSGAETHSSRPRTTRPLFSWSQPDDVRALTKWLCVYRSFVRREGGRRSNQGKD